MGAYHKTEEWNIVEQLTTFDPLILLQDLPSFHRVCRSSSRGMDPHFAIWRRLSSRPVFLSKGGSINTPKLP